jgi:DNA-binding NarL/FixJ family response regulator
MSITTIFLADDHPVVRTGLRLIIETEVDLKVIGEMEDGREAVHQSEQRCADIVIMDIAMPYLNGIEATKQIRAICPSTEVIILSMYASTKHILRALKAGAKGYLLKGSASSEVVEAIRAVRLGQSYLSQKISEEVWSELRRHSLDEIEDPLERLSSREREVLQLVVEGKSSPEIASQLYLSVKTVETYRYRVMQKLNLNDLPSLVKFAIQHGLTSLEE